VKNEYDLPLFIQVKMSEVDVHKVVVGEHAGKLFQSLPLLQLVLENTSHSETNRGIPCIIHNVLLSKVKRKEK
jgi:hypothetical protein